MKSVVILLLAVATANAATICTPKSLYKKDCNLCRCSSDGRFSLCTQLKCYEVKNDISTASAKRLCEPEKIFYLGGLNSCICNRDGTAATCTLRSNIEYEIAHKSLNKKNEYCSPGSTFKLDECNVCHCSKDGTEATCTLSVCPHYSSKPKRVCEPRSVFRNYCNNCICSDDGTDFACTRMMCDETIWNKDGTLRTALHSNLGKKQVEKQVCKPLTQFKINCNTCFCSADGAKYACTKKLCDSNIKDDGVALEVKKQICSPKTFFKEYCNTCYCSKDGLNKYCSMMNCDKNLFNKDGSLKVKFSNLPSLPKKDQICTPRSTYSLDGCNTCTCNTDGTRYTCTAKLCDSVKINEKWGPQYKQGDVCTPGKLFYSECNTCLCLSNGKNARCTFIEC